MPQNYDLDDVLSKTLCVVLAGGIGRRLFPLTLTRSKPAVPFGGNYRIIDIPISNCIHSNLRQIFVLTQYNSASLNRHITQTYKFDVYSQGFVDVLASEESIEDAYDGGEFPHGTADAVRRSFKHFKAFRNFKYALVLAGDQLYRMDFRSLIRRHMQSSCKLTLGAYPVSEEEAHRFGILKLSPAGWVEDFREKPDNLSEISDWESKGVDDDRYFYASMGMYFFDLDFLEEELFRDLEAMDFGGEVIPDILKREKVQSHIHRGYWKDIGTVKSFHTANLELCRLGGTCNLFSEKLFYSKPRFLPPSIIRSKKLEDVLVSDGVIIEESEVENSVIGIRSIIGEKTKVKNSVILGNDFYEEGSGQGRVPLGIGKNCVIENAIIDKNCRIGNNVKIINKNKEEYFRSKKYTISDGIIVIPKDTVIEDGEIL